MNQSNNLVSLPSIQKSYNRIKDSDCITTTDLQRSSKLSDKYNANIFLKREDMQMTRCFKVRGVVNCFMRLGQQKLKNGVVIASDGHFATNIAYVCVKNQVHATIIVPQKTSLSRQEQISLYGKDNITMIRFGNNYEESVVEAKRIAKEKNMNYLHAFQEINAIEGYGTVAIQILKDKSNIDFLFVPVGGGGLLSGMAAVFDQLSPETTIVAAEPEAAPAFSVSVQKDKIQELKIISRFCDASAIRKFGELPFEIIKNCQNLVHPIQIEKIKEGFIASTILELYDYGYIVEPSGALGIAALETNREQIKGKNVVVVLSGSDTELSQLDLYQEMSMIYEGLKYFIQIKFPLRPGILKELVQILGPSVDITLLQFSQKNHQEHAPGLITIVVKHQDDIQQVKENLLQKHFEFEFVSQQSDFYDLFM